MAKSARMAALGRKGGVVGGRARARALTPARRRAIAQAAAQSRWSRPVVTESSPLDLRSLVAHAGSKAAAVPLPAHLESWVVKAIVASRRDSALARMLPVFLWRTCHRLDPASLVREARRRRQASALGFFLELTAQLGRTRGFDEALAELETLPTPRQPSYFFIGTGRRPFERAAAETGTPEAARRWGLLMNMPFEGFASHFEKSASL